MDTWLLVDKHCRLHNLWPLIYRTVSLLHSSRPPYEAAQYTNTQRHTHIHTNLVGHWPAGLCRAGRESFTVNWTRTGFLWESPSLTAAKIPATQTTLADTHTHTHSNQHVHTLELGHILSSVTRLSFLNSVFFFTLPSCPSLNFQPTFISCSILLRSRINFLQTALLPYFVFVLSSVFNFYGSFFSSLSFSVLLPPSYQGSLQSLYSKERIPLESLHCIFLLDRCRFG